MHPALNPFGKRREVNNETPIVVALDVTRSRGDDTKLMYEKLPALMGQMELKGYTELLIEARQEAIERVSSTTRAEIEAVLRNEVDTLRVAAALNALPSEPRGQVTLGETRFQVAIVDLSHLRLFASKSSHHCSACRRRSAGSSAGGLEAS